VVSARRDEHAPGGFFYLAVNIQQSAFSQTVIESRPFILGEQPREARKAEC
jgi:hypothetical protein